MKALLLAAGLGSRLKPFTNSLPKCLIPLGKDLPLLKLWLEILTISGFEQIFINLHYHADAVKDFVKITEFSDKVVFLEEDILLGTGGTLKRNADFFLDDDFFVAHADNVCIANLVDFVTAHKNRPENTQITMMTFDSLSPESSGIVELDENNIVVSFHEKVKFPPSNLANGAVFMMSPQVAEYASSIQKDIFEISLDIIPFYLNRIFTWHNDGYHLDIGNPTSYQKALNDHDTIQELFGKYKESLS